MLLLLLCGSWCIGMGEIHLWDCFVTERMVSVVFFIARVVALWIPIYYVIGKNNSINNNYIHIHKALREALQLRTTGVHGTRTCIAMFNISTFLFIWVSGRKLCLQYIKTQKKKKIMSNLWWGSINLIQDSGYVVIK